MVTVGPLSSARLSPQFAGGVHEQANVVGLTRLVTAPALHFPPPILTAQAFDPRLVGTSTPPPSHRQRPVSPIPVSPGTYGALPPEPPRAFLMPFPVGECARGRSKSPFQGGPRLGTTYGCSAGAPAYPVQARAASVELGDVNARLRGSSITIPAGIPVRRRGASLEPGVGLRSRLSFEAADGGSVRVKPGGSFGYPVGPSAFAPQRRAASVEVGVGGRAGQASVEIPMRPAPSVICAAPRYGSPPRRVVHQLPGMPSSGSIVAPVGPSTVPRNLIRVISPSPPAPSLTGTSAGASSRIANQFSPADIQVMIERINSLLQDTAENRNMLKRRVVQCFKKAAAAVGEDMTELKRVGLDFNGLQTFRDLLLANIGMPPTVFGDLEGEYVRFDFDGTGKLKVNAAYKLVKFHLSEFRKELGGAPETIAIPFKSLQVAGYTITKELGHGNQGTAKLATNETGENFCIKCYKKEKMLVGGVEELNSEYEAMRLLHCDLIAGVFEVFQDSHFYYMVGEPYYGGDFLTLKHRARVQGINMTETWWRKIFRQCFEALAFMHEQAMIHCDIKEPNVMLKTNNFSEPQVVVIDLGVAKAMAASDKSIPHGTPGYVPPEVLETKKWWPKGDIFSMGVCIMQIMTDKLPPNGPRTKHTPGGIFMEGCESVGEILQMTCTREPPFHLMPKEFPVLTVLVENLLQKSHHKRPRALQVLVDPWFADAEIEVGSNQRAKRSSVLYDVNPRNRFATIGIRGSFLTNFIDDGLECSASTEPKSKSPVSLPTLEKTHMEEPKSAEVRVEEPTPPPPSPSPSPPDERLLEEPRPEEDPRPEEPLPCLRHENVLTRSTLEEALDEEAQAVEELPPPSMASTERDSASHLAGSGCMPSGEAASVRPVPAPVSGAVPMPVWTLTAAGISIHDASQLPDQPRETPLARPGASANLVAWNPPQRSQLLHPVESSPLPWNNGGGSLTLVPAKRANARPMSYPVVSLPDVPQLVSAPLRFARVIDTPVVGEMPRPLTGNRLLRREVATVSTTCAQRVMTVEGEQSV